MVKEHVQQLHQHHVRAKDRAVAAVLLLPTAVAYSTAAHLTATCKPTLYLQHSPVNHLVPDQGSC